MKQNNKSCQRCSTAFECKVDDIAACQCTEIRISEETQAYLDKTEYDCLCKSCLSQLDQMMASIKGRNFPNPGDKLEEGYFYMENGMFVFKELYHMHRGSCCKNNCRHCAYGYTAD